MSGVIHFVKLDDLVAELEAGHTVRVAELDVTESTFKGVDVRVAGIGVHVRAFDEAGRILSWYWPLVRLQVVGSMYPGHAQFEEYNAGWKKAELAGEAVRAFLESCELDVRPGIIGLGDVRPLRGEWGGGNGRDSVTDEVPGSKLSEQA